MLADALAAEGVASLRYDKRGIGESRAAGPRESDLRFDRYVKDAAGWITQLRADTRFSRVIVAGHSEGSLIGMLAANKAHADAFVSIAGVAHRASDVLRDQLRPQIGSMPTLWEASESVLKALESGTMVDPLPPSLQRPGLPPANVQPYEFVEPVRREALSPAASLKQHHGDSPGSHGRRRPQSREGTAPQLRGRHVEAAAPIAPEDHHGDGTTIE